MRTERLAVVVVPSYNSERTILRCLASLAAQQPCCPYEVIVIDSSTDSTPALVQANFPSVSLIRGSGRLVPGAARNLGVSRAQGDVVAFLDSDCEADPTWLQRIVARIDQGYEVVGGAVANGTPRAPIGTADYLLTFNEFTPRAPERETNFIPSCNLACTREAFEAVGGFPPDLVTGEDRPFGHAASRRGPLLFDPRVIVYHLNRTRFTDFLRHHYTFGVHSALVRARLALPGSVFVRVPLLSLTLPLIRSVRVSTRLCFHGAGPALQAMFLSPLLLIGILVWSYGFIRTALGKPLGPGVPQSRLPGETV